MDDPNFYDYDAARRGNIRDECGCSEQFRTKNKYIEKLEKEIRLLEQKITNKSTGQANQCTCPLYETAETGECTFYNNGKCKHSNNPLRLTPSRRK